MIYIRLGNVFSDISIDLPYDTLKNVFDLFYIEEELNIKRGFFLGLCNFCFNNNFIKFNDLTNYQVCGISMGTNFSSAAANLFLFHFEFKYVLHSNKSFKVFRYIDDLLIFYNKLLIN